MLHNLNWLTDSHSGCKWSMWYFYNVKEITHFSKVLWQMNIRLIQIGQCRCSPVTWFIEIKKIKNKYCLPSNHHGKRLVMESLADGKQRCTNKKRKKKSVRLCKLCRQLTVSQPSHGECAERELRFDHLSGLTDSVCLCVCVSYLWMLGWRCRRVCAFDSSLLQW